MRKSSRFISQAGTWLDRQPLPLVVVAGIVLGLGIGLPGFLGLRSIVWTLLWGALFVALWRLAHGAEPVFDEPPDGCQAQTGARWAAGDDRPAGRQFLDGLARHR
jgi:hypothetical protein